MDYREFLDRNATESQGTDSEIVGCLKDLIDLIESHDKHELVQIIRGHIEVLSAKNPSH